jgi:hypothetical protein
VQVHNSAAIDGGQRRLDRTQQKRGHQPDALHLPPDHTRPKRMKVEQDVREFGHFSRLRLSTQAQCSTPINVTFVGEFNQCARFFSLF